MKHYSNDVWFRAADMWRDDENRTCMFWVASDEDQQLYLYHAESVMLWEETR